MGGDGNLWLGLSDLDREGVFRWSDSTSVRISYEFGFEIARLLFNFLGALLLMYMDNFKCNNTPFGRKDYCTLL